MKSFGFNEISRALSSSSEMALYMNINDETHEISLRLSIQNFKTSENETKQNNWTNVLFVMKHPTQKKYENRSRR